MVIHSTTFDTEAKVIAWYGGSKWILHSGYVLRGASSGVTDNDNTKTGGNDSVSYTPSGSNAAVTLTAAQSGLPSHSHSVTSHTHSVGAHSHGLNSHTHSVPKHGHGMTQPAFKTESAGAHGHALYANTNVPIGTLTQYYAAVQGEPNGTSYGYSIATVNSPAPTLGSTSSNGDHSHTVTRTTNAAVSDKAAFDTGAASGSTANSTAFNTGGATATASATTAASASESHNHSFTGAAATINTLPSYKSVYIWERTE